jgi:site-specific recombinase XerD
MHQVLNKISGLLTNGRIGNCFEVDWSSLRFQHTSAVRSLLMDDCSAATVNKSLSALRGTLRAAWQLGQMSAEDYQKAAAVKSVRGDSLPAGRGISRGELLALMNACQTDRSIAGVRDAAIIAVMYACGPRRHEVAKLTLDQFDQTNGQILITGKGNKQRTAYLTNGGLDAMADWLMIRGDEAGALFYPINKGGRITARRQLSSQAFYNVLEKRAKEAAVESFSPHDLRRSFVSDLLDAGVDIATVAKMAGHASVTTTGRYDRRGEEVKKKAAGVLHVPYSRRKPK